MSKWHKEVGLKEVQEVYLVTGVHQSVPGTLTDVCWDLKTANKVALHYVNIIREDADMPPANKNWETALKQVNKRLGDVYADEDLPRVTITAVGLLTSK